MEFIQGKLNKIYHKEEDVLFIMEIIYNKQNILEIGEKSNYGKLYNEEGRLIFEREYKNGLRNWEGTYYSSGGLKYEGQFVNGLREGNGTFYWEDSTRWEEPFKNNEINGEGTFYDKEESFPVAY